MAVDMIESTVVRNNAERWMADTYALWSEHTGGSWQLIGGYRKNEEATEMVRRMLLRDWGIDGSENGIREVHLLIAPESHTDPSIDGWDYCRAAQLLGLFYVAGFIDRKLLAELNCKVGEIMQQKFPSWDALCSSYLKGCEAWYRANVERSKAEQKIKERRELYNNFCKRKDGPYRLPWKMPLTANVQVDAGGYYARWVKQEQAWIQNHYSHVWRQTLLIIAPLVIIVLALLMGFFAFISFRKESTTLALDISGGVVTGVMLGIFIMGCHAAILAIIMRQNKLIRAIRYAERSVSLTDSEKELLGFELLDAWADQYNSMEYWDNPANAAKSPAHLLVSEHFFYQSCAARAVVILIRRSDLDYLAWGSETKLSASGSNLLYGVYFYFLSTRDRRLNGAVPADNGMGFFDKAARDKAFYMMGGRVHQ